MSDNPNATADQRSDPKELLYSCCIEPRSFQERQGIDLMVKSINHSLGVLYERHGVFPAWIEPYDYKHVGDVPLIMATITHRQSSGPRRIPPSDAASSSAVDEYKRRSEDQRTWDDAVKQRELLVRLGNAALSFSELADAYDVADEFEEIIQEWMSNK